jgi:hypothetical protein
MRTDCIVKLSKLQIFELNTLVQKETNSHVEGKPPPSDKNGRWWTNVWMNSKLGSTDLYEI